MGHFEQWWWQSAWAQGAPIFFPLCCHFSSFPARPKPGWGLWCPAVQGGPCLWSFLPYLVRELHATFLAPPGVSKRRPGAEGGEVGTRTHAGLGAAPCPCHCPSCHSEKAPQRRWLQPGPAGSGSPATRWVPCAVSLLATALLRAGGCPFSSSHEGWGVPARVGWSRGTPRMEGQAGGWGLCLSWCCPCLCCAYLCGFGEGETHLQRGHGLTKLFQSRGHERGICTPTSCSLAEGTQLDSTGSRSPFHGTGWPHQQTRPPALLRQGLCCPPCLGCPVVLRESGVSWDTPTACSAPHPCQHGLERQMALPVLLPPPPRGFGVSGGCMAGSCSSPHGHWLAEGVRRLKGGDGILVPLAVSVVASTVVALLGVPGWLQRGRRRLAAGCGVVDLQLVGGSL